MKAGRRRIEKNPTLHPDNKSHIIVTYRPGTMSRRSRMSIGPGSLPALGDASSRANRSPFGSSGASDDSCSVGGGSARKDRRAMLDEWRRNRQAAGQPPAAGAASARPPSAPAPSYPSRALSPIAASPADGNGDRGGAEEHTAELTANINYGRPPASAPSSEEAGLSALERYRLRKKRQAEQQAAAAAGGAEPGGGNGHHATATPTKGRRHLTVKPPSHSSSSHGGDLEEEHTIAHGSYNLGTPSRRGKTSRASLGGLGGGAQRRVRRRTSLAPSEMQPQPPLEQQRKPGKPLLPPSYPPPHERSNERSAASAEAADEPVPAAAQGNVGGSAERDAAGVVQQQQHAAAAATAFSQESVESIDSAAMQSRMLQMQNRINKLESEKTELIMSKAPLEARMRQREDAWVKERERLLGDIDARQAASKGADERYRELEMRNEALEEENSRLRLEARASASATAGDGASGGAAGGAKDSWTERLQANSEIKDLRKELRNKDDEIKSLRIEKVSLETEVFGCKQEIESLERNYDELERDYSELETSKAQNSEAEIQLQALTTEHTAMTAQLNATCADLEEIKTRAKADLQAKEDSWRGRESELLFEMSVLKSRAGKIVQDDAVDGTGGDDDEDDPAILKARIEERDRRISELEEQLQSGEQLRRALHNRIQELRGNIRVYVRTRPFLPSDGSSTQSSIDILPDGESLQIQGKHVGETHSFKFDKVFAPSTGQDLVFDEVSEFVQSALDGYHVCLFSYGQTGSGKVSLRIRARLSFLYLLTYPFARSHPPSPPRLTRCKEVATLPCAASFPVPSSRYCPRPRSCSPSDGHSPSRPASLRFTTRTFVTFSST